MTIKPVNNKLEKIKVSLVGLGWVTQNVWYPVISANENFDIVSVFDVDKFTAHKFVSEYHNLIPSDSVEHIVTLKPDIVLIAVPNKFHIEYAELFLHHNISVLIEKPVCLTLEEFSRLKTAAEKSKAIVFPSEASKLREDVSCLTSHLLTDQCGAIQTMNLEWVRSAGIPNPGSWFTNKELAGGGVGYDLGWHMLDVGFSFLDCPEIKEAASIRFADFINKETKRSASWKQNNNGQQNLQIGVEDRLEGFITTENNVGIHLNVAWASHETTDVTRIVVNCQKATYKLETTFGFSPNRLSESSLRILQKGKEKVIKFKNNNATFAYQQQLDKIFQDFYHKEKSGDNIKNIYPIVKSLSLMYI